MLGFWFWLLSYGQLDSLPADGKSCRKSRCEGGSEKSRSPDSATWCPRHLLGIVSHHSPGFVEVVSNNRGALSLNPGTDTKSVSIKAGTRRGSRTPS